MRKIDKLVLKSFVGPFILTFAVVVFILLVQHMLKYFDDLVGKDLGIAVLGELLVYFAIFMTPIAAPLAVLLSSLMTFGNLGEHSELTAIKSAGISLNRVLIPIFFFVTLVTVGTFYSNNYLVPKAALNAYSLLYDIKQKKPALDLKEGIFYGGIPDYSIKVNKKNQDDQSLIDLIIYDHTDGAGNNEVIRADSGIMYTILDDRYLKLELYNGTHYVEGEGADPAQRRGSSRSKIAPFSRTYFQRSEMIFDLSSFDMTRTDQELFRGNRIMRNLSELDVDIDSMKSEIVEQRVTTFKTTAAGYPFQVRAGEFDMSQDLREFYVKDSIIKMDQYSRAEERNRKQSESVKERLKTTKPDQNKEATQMRGDPKVVKTELTEAQKKVEEMVPQKPAVARSSTRKTVNMAAILSKPARKGEVSTALNRARQIKSKLESQNSRLNNLKRETYKFQIQWHKMIAHSVACLTMFLIGAPLGAIIKRGGLGIPVLVSIVFFIIFYILNMQGEKWAKQGEIEALYGVWMANVVLFPLGLFFLRQARRDARLFDSDFYNVVIDKLRRWIGEKRKKNGNSEQE